jgi:hypothetical protein
MATVRPAPTGPPGYSETMRCVPESAHRARLLVCAALNTWRIGELAEAGALIVSELVGNCVRHTDCCLLRVVVRRPSPRLVRIGVADKSPYCLPELGGGDATEEGGRGLLLVDALSSRWGYDLLGAHPKRCPWGKETWAELGC